MILDAAATPYTPAAGGVRLAIRVTPRAARTALGGIVADADGRARLQIRLCAPPVAGAANTALIAFLAGALALHRTDIAIRSGAAGRIKILFLAGDPSELCIRLRSWIATAA
jgi:uncharacterized protein YggU (UPF0235/DUF167 family)